MERARGSRAMSEEVISISHDLALTVNESQSLVNRGPENMLTTKLDYRIEYPVKRERYTVHRTLSDPVVQAQVNTQYFALNKEMF